MAANPAAKVRVSKVPLDLGSFKSVRSFAAECNETLGHLDLLCLNAGRGGSKGDPREMTEDGVEAIVQVNALAQAFQPQAPPRSSGRLSANVPRSRRDKSLGPPRRPQGPLSGRK